METLISQIIYALGWSILHSFWQAAIAYIILCIAMLCIPANTAKIKYNLAMGFQMVILLNFIITYIYFFQQYTAPIAIADMSVQELTTNLLNPHHVSFSLTPIVPYFVAAYIIGFLTQIVLLSKGLLNLRNLRYKGLFGIPEHWGPILWQAKSKFQMTEKVNVYLSNKISTPLTLGYFKPIILFPLAFINHMDEQQIEAILLHELAHIKRNDYLFNLIKVAVETILFFNPFVWAISKIIEKEREHACDEMVVSKTPTAMHYIQTLLQLEELRNSLTPNMAMAATGKKSHLLNRIKRITNSENNYLHIKEKLIAMLLSGLTLFTIAFMLSIKQSTAQEKKETTTQIIYDQSVFTLSNTDTIPPKPVAKRKEIPGAPTNDEKAIPTAPIPPVIDTVKASDRKIKSTPEEISNYNKTINSKEWKDQIEKIKAESLKMSAEINKQVNSKEWKDHIEKLKIESLEMSAGINKQINSKEWNDHVEKIKAESLKMSAGINKQVNSKEWKDQIEKIKQAAGQVQKYFESEQWKTEVKELESLAKSRADK